VIPITLKNIEKHRKLEIFSFSGGNFLTEFVSTVFGGWLFFFYETEIGLDGWLITLGYTIYAVWNAFNSPILGYYTNRNTRLTKRWGRHFPWILISAFPWFIMLFFIYSPPIFNPNNYQWLIFIWFTAFICLFSFFFTIFAVNYTSLFPKKFRSGNERRKASSIIGAISFVAAGFANIFPAFLIQFDKVSSYSYMALFSMIIATCIMILTIPGIRENKQKIDLDFNLSHQKENPKFLKSLIYALKQRNFVVIIIVYFLNLIIMKSIGAAFPYAVKYIFNAPAITIALISLFYIIGAVVSMPLWTKIGNTINDNKKLLLISGILMAFSLVFLLFVWDILSSLPGAFFYGFCFAGFWTIITLTINADVLDEIAVETGERNESIYMGIRGFFVNFSIVAQSFVFTIIHKATGFIEDLEVQTELAQWGIRFTLALIPLICAILALIIFWKIYNITPEKVKHNRKRLEELNI